MSQPYQRFRREALESLLEAATRGHYDQAAQWLNALADFEARVDFSAAAVGCWEERATAFRTGIVSRDGPGDSQRRPSADRNSPAGGSLIRTDGLEGAVLGGGKTRAKALPSLNEPARHIHQACAAGGHKDQVFNTGYRCATCGNHVSSHEGELYGRAEDGRQERRREPR